MDVWVEFKNASRWQAEALFRNFFPCEEDEEIERQQELDSVHLDDNLEIQELVRADELLLQQESMKSKSKSSSSSRVYKPVDPLTTLSLKDGLSIPSNISSSFSSSSSTASSTLWSLASSATSLLNSVSSSSTTTTTTTSSPSSVPPPPLPKTYTGSPIPPSSPSQSTNIPLPSSTTTNKVDKSQFGASNTAYLPPPPDASITAKSKMKPLDRKTLAVLAKKFADVVPEEEFSVAGLQGCQFFFWLLFRGMFIDVWFG